MDVEGQPVMICTPVDGGLPTPGASRVGAACGHEVWLSGAGAVTVAASGGEMSLRCRRCVSVGPSDVVAVPPAVRCGVGVACG